MVYISVCTIHIVVIYQFTMNGALMYWNINNVYIKVKWGKEAVTDTVIWSITMKIASSEKTLVVIMCTCVNKKVSWSHAG